MNANKTSLIVYNNLLLSIINSLLIIRDELYYFIEIKRFKIYQFEAAWF